MTRAHIGLTFIVSLGAMIFGHLAWALAPSYEITIRELIPLADWQKQFKITDGRDRGKVVPLTFHRGAGTKDGWRLDFGDYAGIYLKNDAGGSLMMERLDLIKSRSFIVYEPALPIFARDVASGVAVPRQANFKMYDRETGRLKRIGRATHVVRRVSLRSSRLLPVLSTVITSRSIIEWTCNTPSCICRLGSAAVWTRVRFTASAGIRSRSSDFSLRQKLLQPGWQSDDRGILLGCP